MPQHIWFLILLVVLGSCADDDTTAEEELIDLPEPQKTYILPQSLERRDNSGQLIFQQAFSYASDIFLSSVSSTQGDRADFSVTYRPNFQLEVFDNLGSVETGSFEVSYSTDRIDLLQSGFGTDLLISYFLDADGRINRVLKTQTDIGSGSTATLLDRQYSYSADFNVVEIVDFSVTGQRVPIARSVLTYDFVENPFRDTDDVLRLYFYEDYLPNSRYMPTSRVDFTVVNGANVQQRVVNYSYVVGDNGFPLEREVTIDDGSTFPEVYTDFFQYEEVLR